METPKRITIQRKDIEGSSTSKRMSTASSIKNQARLVGIDVRAPIVIEIGSRWTK